MPEMPKKCRWAEPPLLHSPSLGPATGTAPTPQHSSAGGWSDFNGFIWHFALPHQPAPAQPPPASTGHCHWHWHWWKTCWDLQTQVVGCHRMQSSCLPETILIIKKLRPGDKILNHRVAAVAVAEVVRWWRWRYCTAQHFSAVKLIIAQTERYWALSFI